MTLAELIARTEKRFKAARLHYGHGTDNAHDEAAFLVLRGLGFGFNQDLGRSISPLQARKVDSLVEKRIDQRIPAAYLLKEAWLGGERFYVDRRVIIPRSHIAFMLKNLPAPKTALDLCTGSGCLAVLAARAFPRARVTASDLSADALAVARRNVGRRIRLVQSDLFDKVKGSFDLIVTNPPYVTTRSMRRLPAEYRYEPGLALAAGSDGLDIVRRILAEAPARLNPGGRLICEVGDGRKAVERAFPRLPLTWPRDEVFVLEAPKKVGAPQTRARRARAS
ncbi:MAG TPA: 50S ribosomal protein L3 N(5)-glutamine methyltransferase [Burkholderiales bacterium]